MEPVEVKGTGLVVTSVGPDAWLVRKVTPDPGRHEMSGEVYGVERILGRYVCPCKAMQFGKVEFCKHILAVQELIGEGDGGGND